MKLKPIKSKMVVRCRNKNELAALQNHTGFGVSVNVDRIWNYGDDLVPRDCIEYNDEGLYSGFCTYEWFKARGDKIVDFTDLIELTVEETLSALSEICKCSDCNTCYLSHVCDHRNVLSSVCADHPKEVIRACQKWVADTESKQLQAETVDVCRIIEIKPDGKKVMCV